MGPQRLKLSVLFVFAGKRLLPVVYKLVEIDSMYQKMNCYLCSLRASLVVVVLLDTNCSFLLCCLIGCKELR